MTERYVDTVKEAVLTYNGQTCVCLFFLVSLIIIAIFGDRTRRTVIFAGTLFLAFILFNPVMVLFLSSFRILEHGYRDLLQALNMPLIIAVGLMTIAGIGEIRKPFIVFRHILAVFMIAGICVYGSLYGNSLYSFILSSDFLHINNEAREVCAKIRSVCEEDTPICAFEDDLCQEVRQYDASILVSDVLAGATPDDVLDKMISENVDFAVISKKNRVISDKLAECLELAGDTENNFIYFVSLA